MAYGLWGSRLPIANFVVSRTLFAAVRLHLFYRRAVNRLRSRLHPPRVQWMNGPQSAADLGRLLVLGHEKLNIGGGLKNLAGFINIDFASLPGVERKVQANILDLSFVPDACASHIHSNHVIEHLTPEQFMQQLREYHRILKLGGRLSIRCPNALGAAYGFWFQPAIEGDREGFVALGYPADEDFGNPGDAWMHQDVFGLMHWFYGDAGNPRNQHLNLITPTKLRRCLESSSFRILLMNEPEDVNLLAIAEKNPGPSLSGAATDR